MPSFADVYHNAAAPSVHSTRYSTKSTHPTSSSHLSPDAKPLDVRRMSSSKVGMGRTRGTERSSKPEEAPIGPEFAERTRMDGNSDGSDSPPIGSPPSPSVGKKVLGAFEKRRGSSGSPRTSTTDEPALSPDASTDPVDKSLSPPADESRGERRVSITNFFKKVF